MTQAIEIIHYADLRRGGVNTLPVVVRRSRGGSEKAYARLTPCGPHVPEWIDPQTTLSVQLEPDEEWTFEFEIEVPDDAELEGECFLLVEAWSESSSVEDATTQRFRILLEEPAPEPFVLELKDTFEISEDGVFVARRGSFLHLPLREDNDTGEDVCLWLEASDPIASGWTELSAEDRISTEHTHRIWGPRTLVLEGNRSYDSLTLVLSIPYDAPLETYSIDLYAGPHEGSSTGSLKIVFRVAEEA